MGKTIDIQTDGILLADDWKLFPVDSRNWELCHKYVSKASGRHKAGTEELWHRCGRFYSYNTIGNAMAYVADELMKEKAHGKVMELRDAMTEWERIVSSMLERQGSIHA